MDISWVDKNAYPFAPHYAGVLGGSMHYVDEGEGPPVVMVHGTPTWSFLYRHLIKDLSRDHRCVAPDHIGFGLSSKPGDWSYLPADHARNLEFLIGSLGLENIVLVVHDFGGPIGLSYAVHNPDNVRAVVLFNTWMWSLAGNPQYERIGRMLAGPFGRFMYRRWNFSARVMLKAAWGDKAKLTKAIHDQYTRAFTSPAERQGTVVFARELLSSAEWYDHLWQGRDAIARKPALLLWGMRDLAFREDSLARWEGLLENKTVHRFDTAGHFVQEEEAAAATRAVRDFITGL